MLLLGSVTLNAQIYKDRNFSAQLNFGTLTYFGDLKAYRYIPTTRGNNELTPAYSFSCQGRVNNALAVRLTYIYGVVSGTEKLLDRYFRSSTHNISISGVLLLNQLFSKSKNSYLNERMLIYGVFGVGRVYYQSKLYNLKTNKVLKEKGYLPVTDPNYEFPKAAVVPFGFSVNFKFTNHQYVYNSKFKDRLYFNLEMIMYAIDTDDLDLTHDPDKRKDKYLFTSFGIYCVL